MKIIGVLIPPSYFTPSHRRKDGITVKNQVTFTMVKPDLKTKLRVTAWGEQAVEIAQMESHTIIEFIGKPMSYFGRMFAKNGDTKPIIDWDGKPLMMRKEVVIMEKMLRRCPYEANKMRQMHS